MLRAAAFMGLAGPGFAWPITNYFDGLPPGALACGTPQIGFFGNDVTIIAGALDAGAGANEIYYREGDGPWRKAAFTFRGAHSIARLANGQWVVADTENNQLVQIADLSNPSKGAIHRTEVAGFKLSRPHFVLVEPVSGYAYVIDGNGRLFRLKSLLEHADVWTFSRAQLGYARSLAWFDGRLHIIDSSRGEVVRIESFLRRRITVFRSPRPDSWSGQSAFGYYRARDMDYAAGALSTTGFVPNSVVKQGDWYYGSNNFVVQYSFGGDTRPGRLVRWRSWADFEHGEWEDLSSYLPPAPIPPVPYFLTVYEGVLFAGVSSRRINQKGCEYGGIFQLDLPKIQTTDNAR